MALLEIFPGRRALKQEWYSFDDKMSRCMGSIGRSVAALVGEVLFLAVRFRTVSEQRASYESQRPREK